MHGTLPEMNHIFKYLGALGLAQVCANQPGWLNGTSGGKKLNK